MLAYKWILRMCQNYFLLPFSIACLLFMSNDSFFPTNCKKSHLSSLFILDLNARLPHKAPRPFGEPGRFYERGYSGLEPVSATLI